MTRDFESDDFGINRRTLLKGAATASAIGLVGVPAFSGNVVADHVDGHPGSEFPLYGIDHFSATNKLVQIDSADLVPGSGPITVASTALSENVDVNTLAAHPDGTLYSTDLNTNQAFSIDPDTGAVSHFGSSNSVLGGIAGSAIVMDGSSARWFGITHAGASPASTLFEIDLTDGSTTEKGELHTYVEDVPVPVVATHLGMGVNFLTNELWGVIGDPNDDTSSSVFKVVDAETGEVELTDQDALTGGRSVGAALGPCASVMYVVRKGNEFFGYDVDSNQEYSYGSLAYPEGNLDFDSLAVPYGFECEECVVCESGDLLAKYEFECVETDEELGECVDWDFLPEGETVSNISFASYESKDGEAYEPMSATFETEYCELYAVVKSGQEFEVQTLDGSDGSVTVETANDEKYAISFVQFFCTEQAAIDAGNAFPSNGKGKGKGA
jgi:hypothetical protein